MFVASLAVLIAGAGSASATQGPIAAYSFDAGTGTTLADVSGLKHEGTIEGATWDARGKYGSALSFDGTNDCVSIPNSEDLQLDEEFTLEAWVRPASGQSFAPIFFKEIEATSFYSYSLFLGVNHTGWLEGFVAEGFPETAEIDSGAPLPAKTWSHIAFTSDGAHLRLYVNGALLDTTNAGAIGKSEGPLYLGCWKENEEHYKGKIDEVRVYDRALSGGEVGADMNAALETPRAGPVASYAFDENEGTVAGDSAGEHDGIVEGATWTRGKFGSALEFDAAEEDVVTIPTSADLDLEDFTLEAWVKPASVSQFDPVFAKTDPAGYGYTLMAGGEGGSPLPEGVITEGESADVYAVGEDPLPLNAWTHLAVTSDGDKMRFYVDGVLVDTRTGHNIVAGGNAPLQIGGNDSFAPAEYFDGKIDEVRIYGRALSETEVTTDLHSGIETPQQDPIAAYSFDAGTGTTLEDVSGAGHEGAIEGATWAPRGKYGQSLQFDGENDCVSIPNTEDLQLDEEFTLEAWVRPAPGQSFAPIFFKEIESSGFYSYSLFLGVDVPGRLEGFVSKEFPSWSEVDSGSPLPGDTWSHVAFSSDGAHLRLYVNDALVDTESTGAIGKSEGPLYLGCWKENEEHYKGKIDEVRVYDRALDGSEIGNDMNAELQTPKRGPVASYAFDENTGTVAHDYAGGHDGTVEGATWTSGKFGSALDFDASEEDVVTIPTSADLNLEDFTLEAWVKPSELNELMPAIAKGSGEGFGYALYGAGIGEPTVPTGYITDGESVDVFATGEDPLPLKAWTHIAVTSDGEKMRFYADGKLVDTRTGDSVLAGGGTALHIGGDTSIANPEYFDGKIDEIRIYDRALSESEITTDLHSGIETPQAGPIAAYAFDEGEGSVVEDLTGSGHEGTIEGATWTDRGKYGSALDFDGVDDCIQIPESAAFQFLENEEFTLESWVRPQGEGIEAILTQEDDGGTESEEPFAYSMLDGGTEEGPKGWLREGETGHGGAQAPNPLPRNAWSHVALTDDGAKVRIYVDGELVGTETTLPLSAAEGPLTIGCLANYGNYFKGRIDEVRIYNRPLDESEIRAGMLPLPVVTTDESYGVEDTEAIMVGTINPRGHGTTYKFQYGLTTSYGSIAPEVSEEVVVGKEVREVEELAEELQPETTYHYRLVATSDAGTAVGQDQTLTTGPEVMSPQALQNQQTNLLEEKSWKGFFNLGWSGKTLENPTELNMVEKSGSQMFRVVIGVPDAETNEVFTLAAEKHITILPVISGDPGRQDNRMEKENKMGIRPAWREKVQKILQHYGNGGSFWAANPTLPQEIPQYWEIWNEENYGANGNSEALVDPVEYGDLLQESHEVIKAVDSKANVLLGGLLTVGTGKGEVDHQTVGEFLRKLDKAGYSSYFEALSLHPYAFGSDVNRISKQVIKNIGKAKAALEKWGSPGKNIWVTEIGWPVGNPKNKDDNDGHHVPVSANKQKELLESVFKRLKERSGSGHKGFRIEKVFYYNVQDNFYGQPRDWSMRSGLREDVEKVKVKNPKTEKTEVRKTSGKGKYRPAWYAFQNEAEFKGTFP